MGVLNYLKGVFGRSPQQKYNAWLTDSIPIFQSFGDDIYLSDFVNNAIDRVASEISKIEVKSVIEKADSITVSNDDITRAFRFKPNPLQTTSDFMASVEWLRRKNRNAFIYPVYTEVKNPKTGATTRKYEAFYPLNPTAVYIGINGSQVWEIKMDFSDGSSWTLPYDSLIHLKWRRGTNLIAGGGDDNGMADDVDVLRTIKALDATIQGLPKSIEASLQVKGVYSVKSLADAVQMNKIRDEFEDHILDNRRGIVATDLLGDFHPVNLNIPDIPEAAMKFLKAVIQERYGISAAILSGDYNATQHNAFYQTAIEDFINQFEQAMSAGLFTPREQDIGRRVKAYYYKIRYLSISDKLNLANLAKETGILTLNGINEMFGIEPFAEGNRRLQSLNYVNIEDVDNYQKSKAGTGTEFHNNDTEEDENGDTE